ncbi:Long-chain fatty acid transport protein [Cognatiyoonia koreensis]|uniref:Long-chain fatty acid transport protein n=1 Tax=Cognatiyoonia koreensis TaxID=364200 RepID=A0A1I0P1G3_9RHOB|nr:outer membrane protein transport protein [Cognatiyoonia koreensis]SEW08126.1 Long-chain fatty acid transport protein [Cognatiyoonia koreensis]
MKNVLTVGAALMLTTTSAYALGLDRSGQNIGVLFEDGEYAELTFGKVTPTLDGADNIAFGGTDVGNVANDYTQFSLAYKTDINDQLSYAVIFDQPYGADVEYPSSADGGGLALAGTSASLESKAVTALLRYKFNENVSVHAGLRAETISADITLAGLAYGPLNGYNTSLAQNTAYGYAVGAAYERPDIALRVALTYHSAIEHEFDTTENGAPSLPTTVETPQAVNLDFQTGIAADTLLFGSIRWAEYSNVIVSPAGFAAATGGGSLTDIDDGVAYNIGVGRRFTDQLSASVSVGYEAASDDDLVSPLAPSNGNYSIALGAEYKVTDNIAVSGGVRYIKVGDAQPATADTARAEFTDNDAIGVGIKVGYTF